MRHHAFVLLASLLATLAVAACAPAREPAPETVFEVSVAEDFDQVRPSRVLVRPVEEARELGAPIDAIRRAVYEELIDRRYAPLRLDLAPDAVPDDPAIGTVVVRLRDWDRSRAIYDAEILASGEAFLVMGERTIWEAQFEHLKLPCRSVDGTTTTSERDALAARVLGARLLRALPVKAD